MTNRRPGFQKLTASSPLRGAEDAALDWLKSVFAGAVLVDVVFSSATFATGRHNLGRRFRGAVLVGVSTVHTVPLQPATPESVQATGLDPATTIIIGTSSSYSGTTRWVVF